MSLHHLIFALALFSTATSFKILIYDARFSHSVSNYMGRIADILVDAGHNVDVLIAVINRHSKDGTEKARRIYVQREKDMPEFVQIFNNDMFDIDYDGYRETMDMHSLLSVIFTKQCNETIHYPGLIKQLTEEKYDLVIAETLDFCGVGLSHLIGAKTLVLVATSPVFDKSAEYMGIPTSPSFNPAWTTSSLDVHSMWSRAMNLYRHWLWKTSYINLEETDNLFQSLHGPQFPHIQDLIANSAYYFTNTDPYIDFARPMLKKVVELGGLGIKEPKPLDKKWHNILSLRNRTVLLSFGTIFLSSRLQLKYRRSILEALSQFPDVTFIWKYELDDDFAKEDVPRVPNIVLEKWVPQNDLLNDTRIVAFITHGGMGSTQETAARGVPGIFIPIYVDQPRNAAMLEHTGMGVVFSKYEISNSKKLADTIRRILNNKSYTEKAKKISHMLAKRPFSPRETLIRHVEFAAEFGASDNLRPQSIEMSLVEFYNIDILAILILTVFVLLSITITLLRMIIRVDKRKLKTA